MTAPGNSILQIVLAFAFVVASGYAVGRIHEWYRFGAERDESYRDGYDEASQSLFDMALQRRAAIPAGGASRSLAALSVTPAAAADRPARHSRAASPTAAPVPLRETDDFVGTGRRRILTTHTN